MADNIRDLVTQSDFLQNVDVSTIITSLAIGIAEAQERLDENSIQQISRLTETEVAGKSLLELGFHPAFYAFEFADISASINLKMAVSQSIDVAASLSIGYEKNQNFNKDFFNTVEKNKDKSLYKYSEENQNFSLDAKTSTKVTINNRDIDIHNVQGSISRVEKAQEEMTEETQEIRVDSHIIDDKKQLVVKSSNDIAINKENGYVVIAIPEDITGTVGLLKMDENYSPTETITIDSAKPTTFNKETSFGTTFLNTVTANAGVEIGICNSESLQSDRGIYRKGNTSGTYAITPFDFYFGFNLHNINFDYSHNNSTPSLKKADFEKIALILIKDSNAKITIQGHTDGAGREDYNIALSKRRIKSVKEYIQNLAKTIGGNSVDISSQIIPDPQGESLAKSKGVTGQNDDYRKVIIEFNSSNDYIYLEAGKLNSNALNSNSAANKFIFLEDSVQYSADEIHFEYGNEEVKINASSSLDFSTFVSQTTGQVEKFFYEKKNGIFYLLHEEAQIHYSVFSLDEKEIEVKINNQTAEEIDKETSNIYLSEKENSKSRLKNSTKNVDGDRSLAISGSIDARFSRQFGVSMEGNAAISARIVPLPPPAGLEQYLQSLITS